MPYLAADVVVEADNDARNHARPCLRDIFPACSEKAAALAKIFGTGAQTATPSTYPHP